MSQADPYDSPLSTLSDAADGMSPGSDMRWLQTKLAKLTLATIALSVISWIGLYILGVVINDELYEIPDNLIAKTISYAPVVGVVLSLVCSVIVMFVAISLLIQSKANFKRTMISLIVSFIILGYTIGPALKQYYEEKKESDKFTKCVERGSTKAKPEVDSTWDEEAYFKEYSDCMAE